MTESTERVSSPHKADRLGSGLLCVCVAVGGPYGAPHVPTPECSVVVSRDLLKRLQRLAYLAHEDRLVSECRAVLTLIAPARRTDV